jgi:TonB family protein
VCAILKNGRYLVVRFSAVQSSKIQNLTSKRCTLLFQKVNLFSNHFLNIFTMKKSKKQIKSRLFKGLMASGLLLFCTSMVVAQRVGDIEENVIEQRVEKLERIFTVVEQMPRFPGCEDMSGTEVEKKNCADKKLLEFIYANLQYPAAAKESKIEGIVVVRFIIDKDGSIIDSHVIRQLGGGCSEEALRIVNLMNEMPERWTAGRQGNEAVKVYFKLPIRFRLK